MNLTPAQQATLKAFVEADPVLNTFPHNGDGATDIAIALKAEFSPAFVVWKTAVSLQEITQDDAFNWTRVDNLTVGKARIWEYLFGINKSINAAKANVRAGIDATWVGTQADLDVRTAIYTHLKRNANVLEKLFATGTGTTASPGAMTIDGQLNYQDVLVAMQW